MNEGVQLYAVDVKEASVFAALRKFLLELAPGVEVIRANVNRVPMPKGAFTLLTILRKERISTLHRTYTDTETEGTQNNRQPYQYVMQIDFFGSDAGDRAAVFTALWHDFTAFDNMPGNIKPLYCNDPVMMPITDAEREYQERWMVEARIEVNPVIRVPMEFFKTWDLELIPVPLSEEGGQNG